MASLLPTRLRWTRHVVFAALALPLVLSAAEPLTKKEKEQFLRDAKVVRVRELSMGITNSQRATLELDGFTHDAHVQSIDEYSVRKELRSGPELNFRDSYRFNIAAYRLSELLGLEMVPVSVERKVGGDSCAVTWWVDDALMVELERWRKKIPPPDAEAWNRQMYRARLFNELTYNTDANLGNMVIDDNWRLWLIDYTRGFRLHRTVRKEENLARIDRQMLARLREVSDAEIVQAVEDVLSKGEIRGLLARRMAIVEHFDKLAAEDPDALYEWVE